MRQATREPHCRPVVNKNLGGLLVTMGRMRKGLPFCKKHMRTLRI